MKSQVNMKRERRAPETGLTDAPCAKPRHVVSLPSLEETDFSFSSVVSRQLGVIMVHFRPKVNYSSFK